MVTQVIAYGNTAELPRGGPWGWDSLGSGLGLAVGVFPRTTEGYWEDQRPRIDGGFGPATGVDPGLASDL